VWRHWQCRGQCLNSSAKGSSGGVRGSCTKDCAAGLSGARYCFLDYGLNLLLPWLLERKVCSSSCRCDTRA
jgi:hypothetical protein